MLLVRKQYLPKKNPALLAQKLGKNCQNPLQVTRRQKKERTKVACTTNSIGGWGQNLGGPNTKQKNFFYVCLHLPCENCHKCERRLGKFDL